MSDIVMKQESTLTNKTTPTMTDLLRLVGSDDHSYKALVSDVAKAIIETYAGSTLAGSAQSVKSALDALNSKLGLTSVTLTPNSNIINNATINCYTVGNLLVMSGWYKFKSSTQISQGTVLFTCGKQFQTRYYMPGYDGDGNFSVMYEVRESTNEIRARVAINPNTTPYYYISGVVAVKS